MGTIKLSKGGFTPIAEGTYTFHILEVIYDKDFGKLDIKMVTKSGRRHTERFHLIKNNGETNEGAIAVFSTFARNALDNFEIDEIDPNDLPNHFIQATVSHNTVQSNKDPDKEVTFVNLSDFRPSEGFGETDTEDFDLDEFLG